MVRIITHNGLKKKINKRISINGVEGILGDGNRRNEFYLDVENDNFEMYEINKGDIITIYDDGPNGKIVYRVDFY